MATSGLYGNTAASVVALPSGSETSGLYGNNTVFGGTYFEWFIFQDSATQPATPTGGSWSFTTNVGTPPTGWSNQPPVNPTYKVWISIAVVNSRSSATYTWSTPGLMSAVTNGTVTSVGLSAPAFLSVSGSPVTNSGTLALTYSGTALPVANGGTGTTTPNLVAGTNVSITGTWPNQTINSTNSGGTVTSVTATSPVLSSGGTTPVISLPAATSSVSGYLTSTDWNTFNNKGSVSSVAATVPSFLSVSGSPITSSGTLAITYSGTALPVANGGTGTSTPSLVAGTNVTITGTWPNQTINSTGGSGSLTIATASANSGPALAYSAGVLTGGKFIENLSQLSVTGFVSRTTGGSASVTSVIPVFNGGTGVSASSGANSVVLRDANQNITVNALNEGFTYVAASIVPITLTASSNRRYTIISSGGQTVTLPDATTLQAGNVFYFDNNQSSGTITVNNKSGTLVVSVPSGGYVSIYLLDNSTVAGSWDRHDAPPSNVSWSTNTFDYSGSITSATWNGATVAYNRGGTGQSSAFVAGGVVYGSTTTAMAVTAAGTSGQVLTSAGASAPTFSSNIDGVVIGGTTPAAGTFTTLSGTTSLTTPIVQNSAAAAIAFKTNSATSAVTQFNVSHTASAVNYVQVTGAATGSRPTISAQGSDAIIGLTYTTKGNGTLSRHAFVTGYGTQFLVVDSSSGTVNTLQVTGSASGSAPVLASQGTDGNIDITLTPKGTGRVNITTSIKPKVNSAASVTSPLAWDSTSYDEYAITALANALTINADANASPADGQKMMFRFKDNGTARALTWTTGSTNSFRVVGVTLPTTTVASKLVYVGCVYNAADSRWDAVAVSQEA